MSTILTAGHVNWDVTLRVDRLPEPDGESTIRSQRRSGGGSAANVAVALSRLAIDSALVGSVGDDENGLLARRELEADGVTLDGLRVVADAETAVKYLLVDDAGEVAVLGTGGVNEAVGPTDVDPDRIRSAERVHLTGQRPATAARIARVADDAGVPVSVDPGRRLRERDYTATIALADTIFVTDREAEALLDPAAVAGSLVVVKYGADGAELHDATGRRTHPGFDVDPVDTTGAGDAFAAGFLARRHEGAGLTDALAYANACGALTANGEGARSAPTGDRVRAFLDEQDRSVGT